MFQHPPLASAHLWHTHDIFFHGYAYIHIHKSKSCIRVVFELIVIFQALSTVSDVKKKMEDIVLWNHNVL